jgi:hypothetical protein
VALAIQPVDDVPTLAELKLRLGKTLTVDDAELRSMLDAAVAEYEEWIGPVGTKTLRYDGGGTRLILPVNASAVTAVAYTDGTAVDAADLDFDSSSGLLHWGYGTVGAFTSGSRNVLVTFTVTLPANHREAILADVAGYFAATQRGGGAGPSFSSEGYELPYQTTPQTLFPRIRALAASYPSIA